MGELRAKQVRQLVRLVAEAGELPQAGRAGFALAGLRRIIGAVTAGAVTDGDFAPGSRGAFTALTLDGWDATTIEAVKAVGVQGSAFHPGVRALMTACPMVAGAFVTGTRRTLVEDRAWYGSPFVEGHLLPAHLDHGIFSCLRGTPLSLVHGLGFYRARADKPFSESDRALVELFHAECASLWRPPPAAVDEVLKLRLTPREREALALLLEGHSDKQIADRMTISPFTVNQYNKSIFRRFGVQSRTALLARLLGPEASNRAKP